MLKKHVAFLAVVTLSSLLFGASVSLVAVFGWSNGGYSDDPSNPKYGTHDWIAQRALLKHFLTFSFFLGIQPIFA